MVSKFQTTISVNWINYIRTRNEPRLRSWALSVPSMRRMDTGSHSEYHHIWLWVHPHKSGQTKRNPAMSDNITEFKLRHIVVAVRDVITEWHELGLHLGLPEPDLKLIASNPDIEGRLRMMLSKWLGYAPEASWDKLANALNTMGKNAIATSIRSKYTRAAVTTPLADSLKDDKTCMSHSML